MDYFNYKSINRFSLIGVILSTLFLSSDIYSANEADDVLDFLPAIINASTRDENLGVSNGWFINNNEQAIWGFAGHNSWWRSNPSRPNITRIGGGAGPLRTIDMDPFANSLVVNGFPGYEHNYGLWYDRRRDVHDTNCRSNDQVVGPLLEQPWARSGIGRACDGKTLYDLENFNELYFSRLLEFAEAADESGVVFINNHYMQHVLLELNAHYADFAWRSGNNIQNVSMPSVIPAANSFYDVSDAQKRDLHKRYIFKMLDTLRDYPNIVHSTSQEYTGNEAFVRFWVDTIKQWEDENRRRVHISLAATKDVQDALLNDPLVSDSISSVSLQYWWYTSDGSLFAPRGGISVPGRYALGFDSANTSSAMIYRQIREYRERFPEKAIMHHIHANLDQTWAFLMGGGSLLKRYISYASTSEQNYVAPVESSIIQESYNFINRELSDELVGMFPSDVAINQTRTTWSLSNTDVAHLFYSSVGTTFDADLRPSSNTYDAKWFQPNSGTVIEIGSIRGGGIVSFSAPSSAAWALLLKSE